MTDEIYGLILLPILIFSARILDVSLQTLRIIFTSRDRIQLAPIIGFFEVFIWLLAIGQIFLNITNILYYFVYAAGFATGSYVGIYLDRKLSTNLVNLQLIVIKKPDKMLETLKEAGYGLTVLTAEGYKNIMVQIIIKRKNLNDILKIVEKTYPNAFMSIQQVQSVKGGIFPPSIRRQRFYLKKQKKGK